LIKACLEIARMAASMKPSKLPSGGDAEFVDADIKPIVIDGKVREIRYSRTTSIGIIRLCSIQNID
jgi:hypothetical protein